MVITCSACSAENDLTSLNVGVGHVFDCVGCGVQLRAVSTTGSRTMAEEAEVMLRFRNARDRITVKAQREP